MPRPPISKRPPDVEIVGYSDPLGVREGDSIRFMVSCTREKYRADLVRLVHGDENPLGPGFLETEIDDDLNGEYPGRFQPISVGSAVQIPDHPMLRPASVSLIVTVFPTTPGRGRQAIAGKWSDASSTGYGLFLDDDGHTEFVLGASGDQRRIRSVKRLVSHRWYSVAAGYDATTGRMALVTMARAAAGNAADTIDSIEIEDPAADIDHSSGPFLLAAQWNGVDAGAASTSAHYNGKISAPQLLSNGLGAGALAAAVTEGPASADVIAAWDLAAPASSAFVHDGSPNELHGKTLNMPTRAVTGHTWRGDADHFERAPDDYNAIHFHDDDLDDAAWEPDHHWTVPSGLPSGIYALRLRTGDGTAEDHIPFFVLPPPGGSAEIAFLAPTNCYLAYANERLEDNLGLGAHPDYRDEQDAYGYVVANRLLSLYDRHSDGSGVCYSTRLRPNLTMRPRHRMRINNIPHLLSSDLHITQWLEHEGHPFDVLTEEALHHEGRPLLDPYRIVITGTHPEYWSGEMLDALEVYLRGGGRCMYLGGNGFYWVTAFDPERPEVIEVRRTPGTTRAWEAGPGEHYLSSTGEMGGLWRHRGRAPQRLVGIGFSAQGFDRNAPYEPNPDLVDEMQFVFEGIDAPAGVIGDQASLVLGSGAAGFELDRVDHELGTPEGTYVLASTRPGAFSDSYQAVVEDTMMSDSMQGGSVNPDVRSDMVIVPYPNGGAVFSVGSIAWSGGLATHGYNSDVSKITRNVLSAFLADAPIR